MGESVLVFFVVWLVLLLLCLWAVREFVVGRSQQLLLVAVAVVFGLSFLFWILLPLIRAAPA